MIGDKFLIFLLLGNLILKDYFDKKWTVWLWVVVLVLQVLAVISNYL
jgi:hypothetical protein